MTSVPFFSPIHANPQSIPEERCGFLRGATHAFDFGQQAYTIKSGIDLGKMELMEMGESKPSWFSTLLRVAAIFTVILPVIALIGMAIYRAVNQFQVPLAQTRRSKDSESKVSESSSSSSSEDRMKLLPEDVLNEIIQLSGFSWFSMGSTDKANNKILEENPLLQEHRLVRDVVNQCLADAKGMDLANKFKATFEIAEGLRLIALKKALEIKQNAIKEIDDLIKTAESLEKKEKIEIVNQVVDLIGKFIEYNKNDFLKEWINQSLRIVKTIPATLKDYLEGEVSFIAEQLLEYRAILKQFEEVNELRESILTQDLNDDEIALVNILVRSPKITISSKGKKLTVTDLQEAIYLAQTIENPFYRIRTLMQSVKTFAEKG